MRSLHLPGLHLQALWKQALGEDGLTPHRFLWGLWVPGAKGDESSTKVVFQRRRCMRVNACLPGVSPAPCSDSRATFKKSHPEIYGVFGHQR